VIRKFPQGCGVLCRLAAVLAEAFAEAQGNSISLYPSEVAKKAQVSQQVVGEIFRALAERGYMECVKTERRMRCVVTRSSPLWSAEHEKIYNILETL
jgi:DNA-binding MarR family transcriptional regulator